MNAGHRRTAEDLLGERAKNWPEAVSPVTQLTVRALRFATLVQDNAARLLAAHGLTSTEFDVLATLSGAAPAYEMVPTELYSAVLLSSGGLTKVLYALEERALVTRGEGRADRRSKPVRLTARGRALAERAMADVKEWDEEFIAGVLSPTEMAQMTRLLRKLLARLEPVDAEAKR